MLIGTSHHPVILFSFFFPVPFCIRSIKSKVSLFEIRLLTGSIAG